MSSASDFVPSEEDIVEAAPRAKRRAAPRKAPAKRRARANAEQSHKQFSPRKRYGSVSPDAPSKGSPKPKARAKKQKKQSTGVELKPDAVEAVRLVDAEVFNLPEESELNFTVMEQLKFGGNNPEDPEMHGAKEVPCGHEQCLSGKAFVITGVLESLTREEATELIKRHDGRVTTGVSGKTTFLLVGKESGKSKCDKARELGTKLIDENGLFQLIRASQTTRPAEPASARADKMRDQDDIPASSQLPTEACQFLGQELWVDKYKPQALSEMVGNNSSVLSIKEWLETWRDVHFLQDPDARNPSFGGRGQDPITKKALLLYGSPGIGKTTSALLAAKEAGFESIEANASDSRNKADKLGNKGVAGKTANRIQAVCQNSSIRTASATRPKPLVLIMDEVDGMSGGDRGGIADLIANIKTSKIPIICICNDRYNRKLTSLRNHCTEVEFRKPSKIQIWKRLASICEKEEIKFGSESARDALIEQARGDLRTLIGGLQFIRARTTLVTYGDVKSGKFSVMKNHDINPFEASRALLSRESTQKPWSDLSDTVFSDIDLIPLLVQENYINHIPKGGDTTRVRLKAMAKAATYISFGERINHKVHSEQKWSLLPSAVNMGTLAPAAIMRGMREAMAPHEPNYPRFTSYYGNLSTTNKNLRLAQSAADRMTATQGHSISGQDAVLNYFPVFRQMLTRPLIREQAEGVPQVHALMKAYCIDKEHYDFIMDVTQFKGKAQWNMDPLPKIPARVKAMLTRQINASAFRCPGIQDPEPAKKSVKAEETVESAAMNPESGVIQDAVKEEVVEEVEVNPDEMMQEMKQAGYHVQPVQAKRKSGSVAKRRSTDTGRGSRGRGRRGRGRGRSN